LWVRVAFALIATGALIQLVPYGREHTNPAVKAEPAWDTPETRALAKQACFDCHSNETVWPMYANVAPASWIVQRDVDLGRAALNFSEWQRPQPEAKESSEKVLEGEMPPATYQLMHGHARLSSVIRQQLAAGLARTLPASGQRESHERER
jgi:mono/diheme cytochrome c family protein